jgi:gliding motility-associated-like protein
MKFNQLHLLFVVIFCFTTQFINAQLQVKENNNAQQLAQTLVGEGIIISNATITNSPLHIPSGIFKNAGGTNINIDSGIVLTSGRARTGRNTNETGLNGDGTQIASNVIADNNLGLAGDLSLANELGIGIGQLHDAIALEFDFIPLGDSISFKYVLSSEEYDPQFVCLFNDAFGFFISGPGITGEKNIALIPNTNIPVTITNINNIISAGCVNNPQYYVDNVNNTLFTHDGHTTVLKAESKVVPCETYHLKLVIADRGDHFFDSGVFLEAKSLSSNVIGMTNFTQTDAQGNSYLVEGCVPGSFAVKRPRKDPSPLIVTLSFGGDAINGTDYNFLPTTVTIPANDSFVIVNVQPIIDNIPEGVEKLVVYALAGCSAGTPTDSTVLQLRDFDTLAVVPPGNIVICNRASQLLQANTGFATYQWDPDPTLSNLNTRNPVATPVNSLTTYRVTAILGDCHARDSVSIRLRNIDFISKQDVNCNNGTTGNIKVAAGSEWEHPIEFSLDGINWQADSNFNNLATGNYWVKVRNANCIDSINVPVIQSFPDLLASSAGSPASCSGDPDGEITLTPTGGKAPYLFSSDGTNFQASAIFNVHAGDFTLTVKDNNGCLVTSDITIALNNTVTIEAGADAFICEGKSFEIPAISNASSFAWTPLTTLQDASTISPVATPAVTTEYFVTATTGICTNTDSVTVNIRPAPVANAGDDIAICVGKSVLLNASGGLSYQWSPSTYFVTPSTVSDINPTVKPAETITYSLMVTDINGCSSLAPDEVTVAVTPSVKIFAGNDTIAAMNQPMQLKVVETGTAGVTQYRWSPAFFLDNETIANPVATLPHDQVYTVTGTTADGCEGTDDIRIKVYKGPDIYVPSGFTPNSDGLNDILYAIPVGIKEFRQFRIFNRWGQTIFLTRNASQGWDGKIGGRPQGTGTYIWIADGVDYLGNVITKKGSVTIIR